jgi:hypothetical protein
MHQTDPSHLEVSLAIQHATPEELRRYKNLHGEMSRALNDDRLGEYSELRNEMKALFDVFIKRASVSLKGGGYKLQNRLFAIMSAYCKVDIEERISYLGQQEQEIFDIVALHEKLLNSV